MSQLYIQTDTPYYMYPEMPVSFVPVSGMGKTKLLCEVRNNLDSIGLEVQRRQKLGAQEGREAQARGSAGDYTHGSGGRSTGTTSTAPAATPTAPQELFRSVLGSHGFPVSSVLLAAAATAAVTISASSPAPALQQSSDSIPAVKLPSPDSSLPAASSEARRDPTSVSPVPASVAATDANSSSTKSGGGRDLGSGGGASRCSTGENGTRERPVFHLFSGVADIANKSQKLHPWRRIFQDLFLADAAMW